MKLPKTEKNSKIWAKTIKNMGIRVNREWDDWDGNYVHSFELDGRTFTEAPGVREELDGKKLEWYSLDRCGCGGIYHEVDFGEVHCTLCGAAHPDII